VLYRFGQNLPDRLVEPGDAGGSQTRGNRQGMNPRPEQAFIGIDVPHACKEGLIHEQRLHLRTPLHSLGEVFECDFQRLRPELLYPLGAQFNPSELARIVVEKLSFIQSEKTMCVFGRLSAREQIPGHPQVDCQRTLVKFDHNELSAAVNGLDRSSCDLLGELRAISRRHEFGCEARLEDTPTHQVRRDGSDHCFNFG
jgi:hypothetical protein